MIQEFYPNKTAQFKFSTLFKDKMGASLNATLTAKGVSENTKKLITSIEHRSNSKTASERAKKVYQNQSGLGSPKNSRPANYLLSVEEKEAFLSKGANTNHHHQRFKGSGIGSIRGGERKRSNTRTGSNSRPQSAKKDLADKYEQQLQQKRKFC